MLEQLLIELIEPLHANIDVFDEQVNDVMRKLMQIMLRQKVHSVSSLHLLLDHSRELLVKRVARQK